MWNLAVFNGTAMKIGGLYCWSQSAMYRWGFPLAAPIMRNVSPAAKAEAGPEAIRMRSPLLQPLEVSKYRPA